MNLTLAVIERVIVDYLLIKFGKNNNNTDENNASDSDDESDGSDDDFVCCDACKNRRPGDGAQVPYNAEGVPFGEWTGVGAAMEAFHLAAIEFQLAQLASAAHIAVALTRTLIIPKVLAFPHRLLPRCRAGGPTGGSAMAAHSRRPLMFPSCWSRAWGNDTGVGCTRTWT